MPQRIIAKFFAFVILAATSAVVFSGCGNVSSDARENVTESHYFPPKVVGTVKSKDIEEGSGIAASRCQNDVLWTHNDSGDDAYIFALNSAGESLGTWRIPNAENDDWEDIAAFKDASGKCFIYVGDIGDNKGKRAEHTIYKIKEPIITPASKSADRTSALQSESAEIVRFLYPERGRDAETMMVHPKTGDIYVVTKQESGPAGVYALRNPTFDGSVVKLDKVADVSVPAIPNGLVTGGDISPDGRRVAICDYTQGYEWTLADNSNNFDDIWKQRPEVVDIGKRKHGEAITYSVDGTSLFATSEGKNQPVIEIKRRE